MIFLQALEVGFVIVFLAFVITQIFVPLSKELPLFPMFRNEKTKNKRS